MKNKSKRSGLEDLFSAGAVQSVPAPPEFPFAGDEADAQTPLDKIRAATIKPKHPDRRQRDPVATYRGIPENLQRSLERMAENMQVPVGILARFFLEHGLSEVAAGRLALVPQLVQVGLTLYPEGGNGQHRQRRTRRNSSQGKPVAYRGIPDGIRQAVAALAKRLGVPIGEVVRYFFEHGLSQVQSGGLQPATYPRATSVHTLYPSEY